MIMNSQLSTNELKKQKRSKQATRRGTEPQKWRSRGGLSAGEWVRREGEKVQRIRNINGR